MGLGGAVMGAGAVGHADGGHQRDSHLARTECSQHISYAAIIDAFRPGLARAIGAEGEHDGIDSVYRAVKRLRSGDITDDYLRFGGKLTHLVGVAHQGANHKALPDRFVYDEATDTAGRADNQHRHSGNGHAFSLGASSPNQ
jgi:hypothetical protein